MEESSIFKGQNLDDVKEKSSEDTHYHDNCLTENNDPKQEPALIMKKKPKKWSKKQESIYKQQGILYGYDILEKVMEKDLEQQKREEQIEHYNMSFNVYSSEEHSSVMKESILFNELSEREKDNELIESITMESNFSNKKDDLAFLNKLVISKDSYWKGMFDLLMMFASIFNIFGNAYYSAFGVPESTQNIILDNIVETLFLFDMIFCFC